MRRHIPGLHSKQRTVESKLDGLFLVSVNMAFYRWHAQSPFWFSALLFLNQNLSSHNHSRVGCTAPSELCGNSTGFSVILNMTRITFARSTR